MLVEHEKSSATVIEESGNMTPPSSWRDWLIGRPLANAEGAHQAIGKVVGLAVFSSDALSSVAYGPQELMMMLVVAGTAGLAYSLPVALAIVVLLAILTMSYEQTIHAYQGGGGAYIVARDNLGRMPALIAAAALLTDYILTVSVSISSGVAQITSAYPELVNYRVEIAIGMIMLIMLINLRGVKESGITFAIPTYFFLVMAFLMVGVGFFQYLTGSMGSVIDPPHLEIEIIQPVSMLLILRAFANGTTSVTGVEAISNGIMAFKEPRSRNAGITLIWMAGILGVMLLGVTFLANHMGAIPSEGETVISQMARTIYGGRGVLYQMVIWGTTIILMMAANTAFADFPRLGALVAADGYLPRQLTYRGSRLVFSQGITALAVIASLLVFVSSASVTALIPLYAIGVFLSFTLSQSGMARRWWKSGHMQPGLEIEEPGSVLKHDKGWQWKMVVNSFGAVCTAVVMIVFAVAKFHDGAWLVILLIPVLVSTFFFIHRHYKNVARQLSLENHHPRQALRRNRVIMLIGGVHTGTLDALRFTRTLSDDITAVHVSADENEAAKIREKWETWGDGTRLVILESPYRLFSEPLLDYIEKLDKARQKGEMITIVVPQFIPRHWWERYLHARTADTLRQVLLHRKDIVITEVPYQLE